MLEADEKARLLCRLMLFVHSERDQCVCDRYVDHGVRTAPMIFVQDRRQQVRLQIGAVVV